MSLCTLVMMTCATCRARWTLAAAPSSSPAPPQRTTRAALPCHHPAPTTLAAQWLIQLVGERFRPLKKLSLLCWSGSERPNSRHQRQTHRSARVGLVVTVATVLVVVVGGGRWRLRAIQEDQPFAPHLQSRDSPKTRLTLSRLPPSPAKVTPRVTRVHTT